MKNVEKALDPQTKEVLKAAKEIAVKFIETGRISTANFSDIFPEIYNVVRQAVIAGQDLTPVNPADKPKP